MTACSRCTYDYSLGKGTGVAEAIGNWGFSNEVASPGHELIRMQCLLQRMDELKAPPTCVPKKKPQQMCVFEHSPSACRPHWWHAKTGPPAVYTSVKTTLLTANKKLAIADSLDPIPERGYKVQGTDKWYKLGSLYCPQPSCPVPYCPKTTKRAYCCNKYCT